jgi:hypothetical protein
LVVTAYGLKNQKRLDLLFMSLFLLGLRNRWGNDMRIRTISAVIVLVAGTAACMPAGPTAEMDPITAAVSGRTLTAGDTVLNAGADGSLTGTLPNGTELSGAWTVRDGQWCRTLEVPANLAGTECQDAVLGDGTITIDGQRGPTTWTIQ